MKLNSQSQILITGVYRSGTEYVTLLLNNHPNLSASMYIVNFMRFCYGRYDPVQEESNYSRLIFDAGQRIRSRWKRTLDVHKILDRCDHHETVTYGLLYDLMMSDLFLTDQVRSWAEKTQLVWREIPAFLEMFPSGKVIHIIRDPRSVLASFKKYTYVPEPAYLGAVFNCFDSMSHCLAYRDQLDPARYKCIKFEDVLSSPEKSLIELFDFLEMSADHNLLAQDRWTDALGKPWKHNSAFLSINSDGANFSKTDAIGRWKKNLADWEIALCEAICNEHLDIFGYQKSGLSVEWPLLVKPLVNDIRLSAYLKEWLINKRGVEEFPTDPLRPANWENYDSGLLENP